QPLREVEERFAGLDETEEGDGVDRRQRDRLRDLEVPAAARTQERGFELIERERQAARRGEAAPRVVPAGRDERRVAAQLVLHRALRQLRRLERELVGLEVRRGEPARHPAVHLAVRELRAVELAERRSL